MQTNKEWEDDGLLLKDSGMIPNSIHINKDLLDELTKQWLEQEIKQAQREVLDNLVELNWIDENKAKNYKLYHGLK